MKLILSVIFFIAAIGVIQISYSSLPPGEWSWFDPESCKIDKKFCIDKTGGECNEIGKWTPQTKTCTLSDDVYGVIVVFDDDITLDGKGHTVFVDRKLLFENGHIQSLFRKISSLSGKITVRADNITIKNFVFSSDDISPYVDRAIFCKNISYGDWSPAFSNMKILNSEFTSTGVRLCSDSLIQNNKFFKGTVGINGENIHFLENLVEQQRFTVGGSDHIIQNNTFKNIFAFGIAFNGPPLKNIDFSNNYVETAKAGIPFSGNNIDASSGVRIYNNVIKSYDTNDYRSHPWKVTYENYWTMFDSVEEGCIISETSNFCQNPFRSEYPELIDPRPWHVKDGWLYKFSVHEKVIVDREELEGTIVTFDESATGPSGKVSVSCTPKSGSLFFVGTTQVNCRTPNGVVNTFDVIVNPTPIQSQNSDTLSLNGIVGLSAIIVIIVIIVLIIIAIKKSKTKNRQ